MENNSKREREREGKPSFTEFKINIVEFITKLRKELNLTIEDLVLQMGWSNNKYYSKIVNGYYLKGNKKHSNPTVNYIFGGLNHAFYYYSEIWKPKQEKILKLINDYFLFNLKNV